LSLSAGGVMHEGAVSERLGLRGIPAASEEGMVRREISLARETGCPVHIAHVSTAGSVERIRRAKQEGIPVTAETAPHYFSLDHRAVEEYNTCAKMNPPLREPGDVEAIKKGLAEGVIDVIATDHAPHSGTEKACGLWKGPPGRRESRGHAIQEQELSFYRLEHEGNQCHDHGRRSNCLGKRSIASWSWMTRGA
jgi:dihydroorotase-like cyclic amidohydrolase